MIPQTNEPIAYVMKRYPRLTETFILNEIRAMERLGARLHIFSLLPPEPAPHHPMVSEVLAPIHSPPPAGLAKWAALGRAHGAMLTASPLRYAAALLRAMLWSLLSPTPLTVWKQFGRGGYVAITCRSAGIRHIHAHFANAPAAVARFASVMTGIPFSFTAHAKDLYLTPRRVIQRRARAATFVATCTGYNARYLRELLGADAGKVHLVYHGIDMAQFGSRQPPRPSAQVRPKLVLSVGRLVAKKGHDDLIAACALLRKKGREFRCMIVGEGPLRDALAAQISALGLTGIVTLEGAMTHAELIALYGHADLFALAPRIADDGDRDGIPNVIAEAMATGVAVVSTAVSGIPELVLHERTGLLVQSNDPEALAAGMERLLANPQQAASLAAAARERLEENFDLWSTTRRLFSLIHCDACGENPRARSAHADYAAGAAAGRP
ncbi:MAG TPA: glycosyltransferase [Steroidobacteraceae bacterium]|nr:glycosyltransferase [Steroidobacteraceae bacterium]